MTKKLAILLQSDLVKPIVTPRFAVTCDMELMKGLAQLAKENDLHVQVNSNNNFLIVHCFSHEYLENIKCLFVIINTFTYL